ncbi:MAG: hypothetical protein KatS3mg068_0482 [Candidatus Sericytochromatia bacterium]|nr:MAG: hypothetical protein KatS3mg068_0482 [Candidatus Sericytochromatia bacterium]
MSDNNINSILDSIDEVVLNSTKIPILNKSLLDEEKLINLIDTLRQNLPESIEQAEKIVANKDKILEEASSRAKEIEISAQERAKILLDNNEIIKKANIEANKIINEANREFNEKQKQAINYADSVLEVLENKLSLSLEIIKKCKDEISKGIT